MICGALRLKNVLTMDFADVTYSQVGVVLKGSLEPGGAIVVSSSSLLKPVLYATAGRFWSLHHPSVWAFRVKISRVKGGRVGGKFSQMHSMHSDKDLELDRLWEKRHDVSIVAAEGKQSEESAVYLRSAHGS
ncbi:hypothetical protein LZ30DRAFT_782444 [Colletotrichum cereale]|nr:hypothetical protein LZ30DRAFT_782444 [Colletotrichum cereale]